MSTTPKNTSTMNSNTINNNININICNQALETITTTSPPTPSLTTPSSHTKETSFHSFTNKQIGNYLLLKPIGKGTFSSVYLSLHIPTHITVAIKILEKSKIQDQTDIERIRREITILKQTHHPHIPTLYETISYKQHLFIVMQYIAGGDLFDYIYNENKLPEQTACMIFKQLISCIDYISKIGICHRDIKPENILLNESKTHITLIDFGLSNYCNDNMKLNSSCGSPCYASPEMISGIPYNGTCSDIWSCGVVLYCMLVGCLPFDDDDIQNLYKKILIGEFVLPSTLSSEAIDLIKRLLTVEPKKRITLRQIKTHKWINCVKGDDNGYWKGSGSNSNYVDRNMVHLIKEKFFSGNGYENVTEKQIYESVVNNNCDKYSATYKLYIEYKKNENVEHNNNNNINVNSSNNNTNKKIVCKRKNKSANHNSNNNNNNNRGKSKDNIKSQIHYGNNNNSKQQQHLQSDMNVFVINNIISNSNNNTQNATLTNKTQKQKTQIQRHFTMSSNVTHSTTNNNSHKTSKQYPFQTTSKTPSPFSKQTQHNNTIHNKNQNASPLAKHAIKPTNAKIIKQNRHITKYFTPVALRTQTTTLTTKDTQSNQIMNNDIKQHRQLSHVNEKKPVKEAPYINICESYNIETKIPNNETNKNVKENNITNIKLIYSRRINNNSGSSNNTNTNNANINNPTTNNISKLIFKGMNKKNSISKDKSKEKKKKLILQKLSII